MDEGTKPEDKGMAKEVIRLDDSDEKGGVSSKKEDSKAPPDRAWHGEEVTDLRKEDVLIGRHGGIYHEHPGHIRFREIVWASLPFYKAGSRSDKTQIIEAIVDTFYSFGGRFLEGAPKKKKCKKYCYRVADKKDARSRVASGIRDALKPNKVQCYSRMRKERQQITLQPRRTKIKESEVQEVKKLLRLAGSVALHRDAMGPQSVVEREMWILANKMMVAEMNEDDDTAADDIETHEGPAVPLNNSKRMKTLANEHRDGPGGATDVEVLRIEELAMKQQEQVAAIEAAEMQALHQKIVLHRQFTANVEAAEIEMLKRKQAKRKEQAEAEEAAHIAAAQKRLANRKRQAAAVASAEIAAARRNLIVGKPNWAAATRTLVVDKTYWDSRVEGFKQIAAPLEGQAVSNFPISRDQGNDLTVSTEAKEAAQIAASQRKSLTDDRNRQAAEDWVARMELAKKLVTRFKGQAVSDSQVSTEQGSDVTATRTITSKCRPKTGAAPALKAKKWSRKEELLATEISVLQKQLATLKEKAAAGPRVLGVKKVSRQEELLSDETLQGFALRRKLTALKEQTVDLKLAHMQCKSVTTGKSASAGAARASGAKKRSRQEEWLADDIATSRTVKRKLVEAETNAAVDLPNANNITPTNTAPGDQHKVAARVEGVTKQLSIKERYASEIRELRSQLAALKEQSSVKNVPVTTKRHHPASADIATLTNKAEEEHHTVAARVKESTYRPRNEELPALPATQQLSVVATDDATSMPADTAAGEHTVDAAQEERSMNRWVGDLHEVPATELCRYVSDDNNITPTSTEHRTAHTIQDKQATNWRTQEDSQETELVLLGTCGQPADDRPVVTERRKLNTDSTSMSTLTAAGEPPSFATKEKGPTSRQAKLNAATQLRSTPAGWQQGIGIAELMSTSNSVEMFIENRSDKLCPSEEELCQVKSSSTADAELLHNDVPEPEIVSSSDVCRSSTTKAIDHISQVSNTCELPSDPQPGNKNSLASNNHVLKTANDSNRTNESATMANVRQSCVLPTRELPHDRPPQQNEKRVPSSVVWNRLKKHTRDHAVLLQATKLHVSKLSAPQWNSLHQNLQTITLTLSACNDIWQATSNKKIC